MCVSLKGLFIVLTPWTQLLPGPWRLEQPSSSSFFFSSKHKGQFRKNKYVYEPHFFPPQIKLAFWSPVYGKTCSHKLETTLQFECLCGLYRLRSPFWACVITPRQLPNLSSGEFQTVPSQSVLVPALEKSVSGMKLRGKGTWGMGWRR